MTEISFLIKNTRTKTQEASVFTLIKLTPQAAFRLSKYYKNMVLNYQTEQMGIRPRKSTRAGGDKTIDQH